MSSTIDIDGFVVEPTFDVGPDTVDLTKSVDKSDWVNIIIDEATDLPNYETVSVNGMVYKIMRGVKTLVPPEVINVLNLAVQTKYKTLPDPQSPGRKKLIPVESSSIPWRRV